MILFHVERKYIKYLQLMSKIIFLINVVNKNNEMADHKLIAAYTNTILVN